MLKLLQILTVFFCFGMSIKIYLTKCNSIIFKLSNKDKLFYYTRYKIQSRLPQIYPFFFKQEISILL